MLLGRAACGSRCQTMCMKYPHAAQPYFKLHGSSNWRSADDQSLLIVGGQKPAQIATNPVLMRYARAFDEYLSQPNTRLMIIGYGFADVHINEIIATAVCAVGSASSSLIPTAAD